MGPERCSRVRVCMFNFLEAARNQLGPAYWEVPSGGSSPGFA